MGTKILLTLAAAPLLLALGAAPLRAQAISAPAPCNDGTVATSGGTDACASHGGLQGSEAPRAAAAPPAGVTAKCKDGTFSMAKHRQGACSGHGGVAEWLDKK